MTEQDIKSCINSIIENSKNENVDNQEIKYNGLTLINPNTKKAYTVEEIVSELLHIIDYNKINSINKDELQNIVKLFLDFQMCITKLYLAYNE